MNREHLKQCGIDYEDGLTRFCDNAAMYEKYLGRLTGLTLYDEMKQNIAGGEFELAFESCHKLKAFIGNLSIPELYEAICGLTELLRARPLDREAAAAVLARTEAIYRKVVDTIKGELPDE